jgi:hypothetical protein
MFVDPASPRTSSSITFHKWCNITPTRPTTTCQVDYFTPLSVYSADPGTFRQCSDDFITKQFLLLISLVDKQTQARSILAQSMADVVRLGTASAILHRYLKADRARSCPPRFSSRVQSLIPRTCNSTAASTRIVLDRRLNTPLPTRSEEAGA